MGAKLGIVIMIKDMKYTVNQALGLKNGKDGMNIDIIRMG